MNNRQTFFGLVVILVAVWVISHIPSLLYGVGDIPIHASYIGDEQAPINGALHILEKRNFLALRDAHVTQYGPLMSVFAIPAAGIDFIRHALGSGTLSSASYKTALLWDWTGILLNARLLSLVVSIVALVAVYRIIKLVTPSSPIVKWLSLIGVLLFATNFHFFEYAAYYRHWIFVIAILLWQVFFIEKIRRQHDNKVWLWVMSVMLTVVLFGISYFGIIFQLLWLPIVWQWWKNDNWKKLSSFVYHAAAIAVGCALIVLWVPGPFYRAIGIGYGDIIKQEVTEHINEYYGSELSFSYYGEIVAVNNISLLLAMIIAVAVLWKRRQLGDTSLILNISFAAVVYFVFFSIQSHHEPRYILPSTVLLLLVSAIVITRFLHVHGFKQFWSIVVITLLCIQIVYHTIHIGRFVYLSAVGPQEQRILEELLPLVHDNQDVKILVLQDNLLGYPHTQASYMNYAQRYNFTHLSLFRTLQNDIHYQDDALRLEASYFSFFHLPYNELPDLTQYDVLVTHFRVNEPDVPNERDSCAVNIVRYWWPQICQTEFNIIHIK